MIEPASAARLMSQGGGNEKIALGLGRLAMAGTGKGMTETQINAVAKDFESMFLSQMLGSMFGETLGDLFGDAETKDIYKSMMMNEYGKEITRMGGIGIASFVKRELLALQEVQ